MWGIKFDDGAQLFCGSLKFSVTGTGITDPKWLEAHGGYYEYRYGPHGNYLSRNLEPVTGDADAALLAALPPEHDWTLESFWAAAYFWNEGRERGRYEGRRNAMEQIEAQARAEVLNGTD